LKVTVLSIEKKNEKSPQQKEAKESEIAPSDAFREMEQDFDHLMERFQREFDDFWQMPRLWRGGMHPFMERNLPSVDIEDRGADYRLTADLPGFSKDDINVEITSDQVTIRAQKRTAEAETKKNYVRRERSSRTYLRRIDLPTKINSDDVKANLNNGQLEIVLPKKEIEQKKKLAIT
jgi:HSP20 family protein